MSLRSDVLKLAASLPSGDPSRRKLLHSLTAGGGTIYAEVDSYGIRIWVAFAGYGRVHQITSDLKQMEKRMFKAMDATIGHLKDTPEILWDRYDIFAEPLDAKKRMMVMSGAVRSVGGGWDSNALAIVKSALARANVKLAPYPK